MTQNPREVHFIPTHGTVTHAVNAEVRDEVRPEMMVRRGQRIGRLAIAGLCLWVSSLVLALVTLNLHGLVLNWTHTLAIVTGTLALILMGVSVRNLYTLVSTLRGSANMGSYNLERLLGKGGMGEVWSAKHRLLARPAAVKLIKAQAMGAGSGSNADVETARVRFAREAQAIARLSSPHTVQLFDFGIADSGDFYYVMELLNGFTMEQMVERYGQVDPARVIYLLVQAAESLAEAHQAGLVHRDVKPANIFVCRYGMRYDFVKVLDFGLVKDRTRELTAQTVTTDGTITGTPAYMAPEIALGKINIDARADIYSLGCVAFWLLTGKNLFEGDTVMEVLVRHVNAKPPSLRDHVEVELPDGLEEAILRTLAKDPDDRPQTMDELIHELLSVKVDAPWNFARARRWWEAHVPEVPAISATGADSAVRDRAVHAAVAAAAAVSSERR